MLPTEWFAALYAAMLMVLPDAFATTRYLLPLLPVLVLLAMSGAQALVALLPNWRSAWVLPALGVVLASLALPGDVAAVGGNRRCSDLSARGVRMPCHSAPWRAFAELADWVRENTPEDAVVVTRKPRLFYLLARRRGDGYPFTTDSSEMLRFLDDTRADYVVIAGLSDTTSRYLFPVIREFPERFPPVLEVGEPDEPSGYVLRYRPAAPAPNSPD
jgi:hypothetical protein